MFRGDCGIHINLILKITFMEAISFWLLLNKPYSLCPKQRKLPSHTCYIFPSGMSTESYNKNPRVLFICIRFCSEDGLWGRNVDWGCFRIGCWREYLGQREPRYQRSGVKFIMKSLMICNSHSLMCKW
jgi:hypothetical protein